MICASSIKDDIMICGSGLKYNSEIIHRDDSNFIMRPILQMSKSKTVGKPRISTNTKISKKIDGNYAIKH